ncbi:hypothetical protein SODALDRAFT_42114 [Sodiomyces alkalinus F11]|uniref:Malic acid transport protein n=1 Tax=Sodiomyces alkalinus (strain CBS 110278 / VKM F-3762 / F11) TaxID=1314773 RepID=A0A3N2Q9X7_SODAK|nr:hypothetical protein SODALDRAFT_42114 [Sodiomyces alkalinus F11]ROT43559.1 hypothetical protein SODALDRAFT_42114 [Sodiomyces alkalinus F11]
MAPSSSQMAPDVTNSGYESPTENSQPPFFTSYFPDNAQSAPLASDRGANRPGFFSRRSCLTHPQSRASGGSPSRQADGESQTAASSSLAHSFSGEGEAPSNAKVSIRDRIACYQWTWFTMTMATGGVANVIYVLSYRTDWLDGIGLAFFLFNIFLFILNCALITIRFCLQPGSFMDSFTDQTESLFIPSFFVSISMILINSCQYGVPRVGPWLLQTMEVMFWINMALSVIASAVIYLILWSSLKFPIHTMTPVWVFPAYPLLLNGPFAANLVAAAVTSNQELSSPIAVALAALAVQGTGFLIALMISSAFIYRLMTQKLPTDAQRPGVFISIGPYAFTMTGIVQLGNHADVIIPQNFMGAEQAVPIVRIMSLLVGVWLWGVALWFFMVSVGSLWKYVKPDRKMPFMMTWWSFVFPNTALAAATAAMGSVFDNDGLKVLTAVKTACLVFVWAIVFVTMLRSLKNRTLLWPKTSD